MCAKSEYRMSWLVKAVSDLTISGVSSFKRILFSGSGRRLYNGEQFGARRGTVIPNKVTLLNVPYDATNEELSDMLKTYKPEEIHIHKKFDVPTGIVFLSFSSTEDAKKVIDLSSFPLRGRTVYIKPYFNFRNEEKFAD